jgi:hypothetical protein
MKTRGLRGAVLLLAALCVLARPGPAPAQLTVTIGEVPGQRIDERWHRYLNARYGFGIDIPAGGFVYELSDTGDGLTLTSADGETSISVYGAQDIDPGAAESAPMAAFAEVAQAQIDAMRLGAVNIVEERIEPLWFEVATTDDVYRYYQKGVLSLDCPTFTANLWIKYPIAARAEFERVRGRMAASLQGNCPSFEEAAPEEGAEAE